MGKVTKRTGRGGPRKGAGRKPAGDPKVAVTIYVESSIVKSLGGIEGVREECYSILKMKFGELPK